MTCFFDKYWSPFVRCFPSNKPKVKFMHSSIHTEHYRKKCIFSHIQNMTVLRPSEFLTGTDKLLLTHKGWAACPRINDYQDLRQTHESVSVAHIHVRSV